MIGRQHSLAGRLTRMNLLVSGTVLVMAAMAFFSYDLVSFRRVLILNLEAEAQIIGETSISALLMNDHQSAESTLKVLERVPDILSATLTTGTGAVFAHYGIPDSGLTTEHPLAPDQTDHVWTSGTRIFIAHRIYFEDQPFGTVYISATLIEIAHRAREYFILACIILLFCMTAALLISSFSRRLIAQPVIALADTARRVSRDQDYSVRARVPANNSEIAFLIDAFNMMLTQIQDRDAALNQARNQLEARVEERTAALRAANKELEAFSYTVAHDLRNPLNAVGNLAFLLAQAYDETADSRVQGIVQSLQTSVSGMAKLIEDLLNFARASSTPVKSTQIDLTAIAREIAAELERSNPLREVKFVIDETPEVVADPALLRVVLINLLGNSWKYTSHHPRSCIEFGVKQVPSGGPNLDKLIFFVRDDGAGFDTAFKDQLFRPFQRLHPRDQFPGTGIGLATVQRILARHGGEIWAEGAVEKGATFYFTLNTKVALPISKVVGSALI
jgi:signal transduction histidine kinase